MAGLNDAPFVQSLAVPTVCFLIAFLGYYSQYMLQSTSLEPGPPSRKETIVFNTFLLSLWYTYYKTVTEDPGRYVFLDKDIEAEGRWCKKCSAPKPARAHHCRHCGRCIPKMDHHCPWTANCISMTTFPHFLRFLIFANISLWMLEILLWQRVYALWEARHLPAYLGPTLRELVALALTSLICLFTSIALGIMLITAVKSWLFNCTMIEGWQVERHEAVMDRGGRDWWDINGTDGKSYRVEKVEFPYDLGIFANMSQAMGTSNFLSWISPFSSSPKVDRSGRGRGWEWEENGFNRKTGMWPPLDPEKVRMANSEWPAIRRDFAAELRDANLPSEERKRAFKERQLRDVEKKKIMLAELEEIDDYDSHEENTEGDDFEQTEYWRNTDGERLEDFGVDEDAEDCVSKVPQEDDIPLADLLRRRKGLHSSEAN
ncbi:Palmitoyltransferase [Conoideocrella luteorostrata]|uniref:Palmitoyltransferase PFA4 n=1 Tax=Conoideocrella luteorostrata TaxID=1105319 RepID=A0AAJ0CTT3_9HYPO|nr:Palmitoyltransferase [Conoideocrella luteorostrata]